MIVCKKCDYFRGFFRGADIAGEVCKDCMKRIDGFTVMTNWVPLSCLKVSEERAL